jgi:hypothetical protein
MKYLVAAAVLAASLFGSPAGAPAQDRPPGLVSDLVTRDVKTAIAQGLEWLAARQNSNGSWNCKIGYKLFEDYHGEDGQDVGVTSLCGMAYLGAGHLPNRGKYGKVVARALDFVLSCVREEDGYITANGSRMYSHAFATMFLAEAHGTTPRSDLRVKLKRSVNLIVGSQNREGGWRYQPIPVDADLSVTVSTLQALRAARNSAGAPARSASRTRRRTSTRTTTPASRIRSRPRASSRCTAPGNTTRRRSGAASPTCRAPRTACGRAGTTTSMVTTTLRRRCTSPS